MAKYETKQIRVGVWGQRKVKRLVAKGWQVMHTSGGVLGSSQIVTLRREKAAR